MQMLWGENYEVKKINCIVLKEEIARGERVRSFVLEGKTAKGWKPAFSGSCIGHKLIVNTVPVGVSQLRLTVGRSVGIPLIKEFSVYQTSDNPKD